MSSGPFASDVKVRLQPGDPTKAPIDISSLVSKLELVLEVGKPNKAILHTYNVETDAVAEVAELKNKILPPPVPPDEFHVWIGPPKRRWFGRMQSRLLVEKLTTLPGYGLEAVTVETGWTSIKGPKDWAI